MMAPTFYRPAWALLSAGNVASFPVLTGIESLTILVDHDKRDQHGRRADIQDALDQYRVVPRGTHHRCRLIAPDGLHLRQQAGKFVR